MFGIILCLLASLVLRCLTCNITIRSPGGTLTSPNYPLKYPRNQNCYATMIAPENTQLVVVFASFYLEISSHCLYDYVEVYPILGAGDDGKAKLCGDKLPGPLVSRSNKVTLRFWTDSNTQYSGFKMHWKTADTFVYHPTPMTWFEAADECSREGGALARNDDVTGAQFANQVDKPNFTKSWTDSYLTPWVWYKGCLHVQNEADVGNATRFKTNKMTVCLNHCSKANYFALQGDQCICLGGFDGIFVKPSSYCTTACPGDANERCGTSHRSYYTVYMNDICFNDTREWVGTVSQSIGGKKCDPWTDHYATSMDYVFPDGSVANASNFCRDPDGSGALWCFSGGQEQYCDVPLCFAKDNIEGSPSQCMEFQLEQGIISARQVDCSSSKKYLYLVLDNRDGKELYSYRKTIRSYSWDEAWASMKEEVTDHTASLSGLDHSGGPYWRGINRGRLHAPYFNYIQPPMDCYQMEMTDGNVEDVGSNCLTKAPFICQQAVENCGETFTNQTGTIYSPNYPENYGIFLNCVWRINVTSGYYVSLRVEMDIEASHSCQNDFIRVYDGKISRDLELGRWCGNISFTVNSTGSHALINFRTDETIASKGFTVEWTAVSPPTTITTTTTIETTPQTTTIKLKKSEKRMGSTEDSNSDVIYAVIAAVVVFIVIIILTAFFLVRRCRARKAEKDPDEYKDMRICCTKSSDNKLKLVVTKSSGENASGDVVYDNTNFQVPEEMYLNCNTMDPLDNNGAVGHTDADPIYSKVYKPDRKQELENKTVYCDNEDADMYDHTNSLRNISNRAERINTIEDPNENIYNHTCTINNIEGENQSGEHKTQSADVYDRTGTLQGKQTVALEDSTYSTVDKSGKEATGGDVYDHTFPQTVAHRDDTYNTFDQTSGEHLYNKSGTLEKARYDDSTYNIYSKATNP